METKALTTGEISKYCGVHFRTVIRWIERGQLRAYQLPGRGDNRVPVPDFVQFLQQHNMPVPAEFQEHSRRILVAEDDPVMAEVIEVALKQAGYEPKVATDGLQAGMLLESFRPRVLSLDLEMPDVSGFDVLKFIRNTPSQVHTKILVVSGASQQDLDRALEYGAHDVLAKPFEKQDLLDKVEMLMGAEAAITA